jgi:threonine dehydratase
VVAASAGNHAQALAFHGKELNIPVTVVMPIIAPIMKVSMCRHYGAEVMVQGADINESKAIALHLAKEKGLMYINGSVE